MKPRNWYIVLLESYRDIFTSGGRATLGFRDVGRKTPGAATKKIAFLNQKGGVGKTTSAINLSATLAERGYKCLIVDLDPQGNSSTGLDVDKDSLERDLYDVIIDGYPMADIIQDTCCDGVFVAPSTVQLAGAEVQLVSKIAREMCLKTAISTVSGEFDYVFIDCPPSLGLLTINALTAADGVLVPIQCEFFALEGVTKILESIKMVQGATHPSLDLYGILLTMYNGRTSLCRQVEEETRGYFGDKVFKTVIPRSIRLAEAPSYGKPITQYAHLSKGAEAYENLADEVIERG